MNDKLARLEIEKVVSKGEGLARDGTRFGLCLCPYQVKRLLRALSLKRNNL